MHILVQLIMQFGVLSAVAVSGVVILVHQTCIGAEEFLSEDGRECVLQYYGQMTCMCLQETKTGYAEKDAEFNTYKAITSLYLTAVQNTPILGEGSAVRLYACLVTHSVGCQFKLHELLLLTSLSPCNFTPLTNIPTLFTSREVTCPGDPMSKDDQKNPSQTKKAVITKKPMAVKMFVIEKKATNNKKSTTEKKASASKKSTDNKKANLRKMPEDKKSVSSKLSAVKKPAHETPGEKIQNINYGEDKGFVYDKRHNKRLTPPK